MTAINRPGAKPVTTQRPYSEQPVRARGERATHTGNAAPATPAVAGRATPAQPQPHAVSAEIPPTPTTTPPPGDWTDRLLDKTSAGIDTLEKEIASLDLNSADGNKKMLLIQRKLQRLDEIFRFVSTKMAAEHDLKKAIIANMR